MQHYKPFEKPWYVKRSIDNNPLRKDLHFGSGSDGLESMVGNVSVNNDGLFGYIGRVAGNIFSAVPTSVKRAVAISGVAGLLYLGVACGGQATSPSLPPTGPSVQVVEESQTDYSLAEWMPADQSNYRLANRKKGDINLIVIHTTEATTLESTISWFKNPDSDVSSHYLIGPKGKIIQMVREKDIAWHAREYNDISIGIEHVGKTNNPNWAAKEMYQASAELVRHLTQEYGIPRDRSHIKGHDELHNKTDPGKFWDWDLFMSLVTGKKEVTSSNSTGVTQVPAENIAIRVLTNPYRFEPSKIEMKVGKTYLLQFIGSDEVSTFLLDELNIGITIPANQTTELLFAAGNEPKVYYFYSDHKNGGNVFVRE